jgi:hypothetical protein
MSAWSLRLPAALLLSLSNADDCSFPSVLARKFLESELN